MKIITCSFCGDVCREVVIRRDGECFCTSRHAGFWRDLTFTNRQFTKLLESHRGEIRAMRKALCP